MKPRLLTKYVKALHDGKYHRVCQYTFTLVALNHSVCGKGIHAIIYPDRPTEWRHTDMNMKKVKVKIAFRPRKENICANCLRMSKTQRQRYEK